MKRNRLLLDRSRSALLVVDIQKKLVPVMYHPEKLVENTVKLIRGFKAMTLSVYATEQYPEGIGETVDPVREALSDTPVWQKMTFSCCGADPLLGTLRKDGVDQVVLCGIESHVCVWQTAMDLTAEGFQVVVAGDGVSSRSDTDLEFALQRMTLEGIRVASVEMILFELVREAGTPEFKSVLKLVK